MGLKFHCVNIGQFLAEFRLDIKLLNKINPACIYDFGIMVIKTVDQKADSIRFTEFVKIYTFLGQSMVDC